MKKLTALLAALILLCALPLSAFADGIRLFEEERLPARDDLAFEEIYREVTGVYFTQSYAFRKDMLYDAEQTAAEFGFEVIEPDFRPHYTLDELLDLYEGFLERMSALDYENMSLKNQFNYDFLKDFLETELMRRTFGETFRSAFADSIKFYNVFLGNLNTEEELGRALEKLRGYYDWAEACCAHELTRLEKGLALPANTLNSYMNFVLSYIQDLESMSEQTCLIEFLNPEEDDVLSEETLKKHSPEFYELIHSEILPAYELIYETLGTIKSAGIEQRGLCAYEGGEAYYRYLIKKQTGIDVDDFQAFIDEVYVKYNDGMKVFREIPNDPDLWAQIGEPYAYDFDNMTDEEIFTLWTEIAKEHYPAPVSTECEIVHVYDDTAMYTAAYPYKPYGDTSNIIKINDADTAGGTALKATSVAHEGICGHMYHKNMLMAQKDPLKYTEANGGHGAFCEGWAYSNQYRLFEDIGANETQQLYYKAWMKYDTLCLAVLRSMRIHSEGFTAEEYCEYLGATPDADDYEYILNYSRSRISDPVYDLKSFIGFEAFDNAYDRAREALGDDFDEIEYTQFLMDLGACDMDTLEKWEGIWIEKALAAHAEAPEVPENPEAPEIPETPVIPENPPTGTDLSAAVFIAVTAAATVIAALKKRRIH